MPFKVNFLASTYLRTIQITYFTLTSNTYFFIFLTLKAEVLFLLDRPDPPDLVNIVGSCWAEDAMVVWRTASLNNEGELQHTLIDWSTTYEPANWSRLARKNEGQVNSGTELKLDFSKLPPFSQISFRVILVNRLGESDPSERSIPSDCITRPSGKFLRSVLC